MTPQQLGGKLYLLITSKPANKDMQKVLFTFVVRDKGKNIKVSKLYVLNDSIHCKKINLKHFFS